MPQHLGVFFCDLSASQKKDAEARSAKSGTLARGATVHELRLIGSNPNLGWGLESSFDDGGKGQPIDALTEDLLAFASHLYQADQLIKRPQKKPHPWIREIELHVGVQDERLWNDQATELTDLLHNLTHDTFRLSFYQRADTRPVLRLPATGPSVGGGVCVFSTHFKSVFGIACQSERGDLIASVRYGPGSPKSSQQKLIAEISRVTNPFSVIAFRLMPVNLPSLERTQRSLGFLQVALAAGLARRLGLPRIQLFDDAVSSYHLRDRQICGPGYAVRDTHPQFLWQTLHVFEKLKVVKDLKINNPFQFYTATQILACLSGKNPKARQALLLQKTDSCLEKDLAKALSPNWKGTVPHCGCCFPCKLRRLAALAADLETRNAHRAYAIDPLNDQIPSAVLQGLGTNLKRRVEAYHIKGLSDFKDHLENFQKGPSDIRDPFIPEEIRNMSSTKLLLVASPPGPPKAEVTVADMFQSIFDAHARFYREVQTFLP
ncbi:MAG TPA: hypothetical protein VF756_27120 [Thermoanaerobaculia bacterium]